MASTKDRVLKFIELKGLSKNQYCLVAGLSNGFLDKVENIGSDKIESIISKYPELSLEWLITGKGEMLRTEQALDTSIYIQNAKTAIIPVTAKGGAISRIHDEGFRGALTRVTIPGFEDCEIGVFVQGDSMCDNFSNGDLVLGKRVEDKNDIRPGEPYIIVIDKGG